MTYKQTTEMLMAIPADAWRATRNPMAAKLAESVLYAHDVIDREGDYPAKTAQLMDTAMHYYPGLDRLRAYFSDDCGHVGAHDATCGPFQRTMRAAQAVIVQHEEAA